MKQLFDYRYVVIEFINEFGNQDFVEYDLYDVAFNGHLDEALRMLKNNGCQPYFITFAVKEENNCEETI